MEKHPGITKYTFSDSKLLSKQNMCIPQSRKTAGDYNCMVLYVLNSLTTRVDPTHKKDFNCLLFQNK